MVALRIQPSRRGKLECHRMPFGPSSPANDYALSVTDWRTTIPVDAEREPLGR
jgi:hypothetical protein